MLRSSMDLPQHLSLDCSVRYVDSLPAVQIGSYVTLDARLGWRPNQNLEMAIIGQNLLQDHHLEFNGNPRIQIPRGVYGQVTLRW